MAQATTANSESNPPATVSSMWPDVSLLGVALIWGINIPVMKNGLDQVSPYFFNAIRLTVSCGVLMLFVWLERRRGIRPSPTLSWRKVGVYSLIASTAYQLFFLLGISGTTSGNTALIFATVPMWTALIARIFLKEKLQKIAWGGLAIALAGTLVVAFQKNDVSSSEQHILGNLCMLSSTLAWAVGTVYSRPILKHISPMQLSAFAATMALPLHLLLAWGQYQDNLPALKSFDLWMIIVYSGALSTGLALPMWNFGVRHAGAAHAAVVQNLIPFIAIVTAWLSRGETASTVQVTGGGLIIGGLILMRLGRRPTGT